MNADSFSKARSDGGISDEVSGTRSVQHQRRMPGVADDISFETTCRFGPT
jgi:hypothetical protein